MSNSAVDQARKDFVGADLGMPPIPATLSPLLRGGNWDYRTSVGPSAYNFDEHVDAARAADAPDSLVLAHAGHGSNSYAISYYLVLGNVRILLQLAWGGAYMNPEETTARIRSVFEMLERRWPAIEQRATRAPVRTFEHSDFYSEETRTAADIEAAIEELCAP
jgi:hypothetical protein